jgi:hypothetical protein
MLAASVIIMSAVVDVAARDAQGAWSWSTLRGRALAGCGLAFVLLIVLSVIVPVETGVWAVGDSAQGFSMFTSVESVAVALTAAVKARRRPGAMFFTVAIVKRSAPGRGRAYCVAPLSILLAGVTCGR